MGPVSLRLAETDRDHLIAAAAALGVEVSPEALQNLARFADVLDLWSRKVNLVSCRSSRELIDRHVLDSLAVNAVLPDEGTVVDLGSGAGFPGVPLAVIRPDQTFVLVETRQRRASFLAEVRRTLGLRNVQVLQGRAEDPPVAFAHAASVVISRAVWPDRKLTEIAALWLGPAGMILRMRSARQGSEYTETATFEHKSVFQYRIGVEGARCVDILGRREAATFVSRETKS